jgi:hypothetical protein
VSSAERVAWGIKTHVKSREGKTTMMGDDERPRVPLEEDNEEMSDRCRDDREQMTSKETADCAGMDLVREYENEEDGGS